MKVYKFRSLGDEVSFDRVKTTLSTGKFWCSPFWDMNDPMEGVYATLSNIDAVAQIFEAKSRQRICSFSSARALRNPLMWGYYSSGFKGVAIEVDVTAPRLGSV